MNTVPRIIAFAASLAAFSLGWGMQVVFDIDPSKSELTLEGWIDPVSEAADDGQLPMEDQGSVSGSLSNQFSGTLTVNLTDQIDFVSSSLDAPIPHPGISPDSGNPPDGGNRAADLGFETRLGGNFLGEEFLYGAVRNLSFNIYGGSTPLEIVDGDFDAASLNLQPAGFLFYQRYQVSLFSPASQALSGTGIRVALLQEDPVTNTGAANGSLELTGLQATLTLPVNFQYGPVQTFDEQNNPTATIFFTISGTLEATATLTEPPLEPMLYASYFDLSGNDASPAADPDADGFTNKEEAAFGTNPNHVANPVSGVPPVMRPHLGFFTLAEEPRVGLTFPVRDGGQTSNGDYVIGGVTYSPRTGSSPSTMASTMAEISPAQTEGLPSLPQGYVYRTFAPPDLPEKAFFQISLP